MAFTPPRRGEAHEESAGQRMYVNSRQGVNSVLALIFRGVWLRTGVNV